MHVYEQRGGSISADQSIVNSGVHTVIQLLKMCPLVLGQRLNEPSAGVSYNFNVTLTRMYYTMEKT